MRKIHVTARRAAVLAAAALTLSVASATAAGAAGPSGGHGSHITMTGTRTAAAQLSTGARHVHYAVTKRFCAAVPAPGQRTCFGVKRVPASKNTPGARAYAEPSYQLGPAGGFTPLDLAVAYNYDLTSVTGASQTVAVVDAFNDPHARADLNQFDSIYGFASETSTSFRKVNQRGQTSPLPTNDSHWSGEIALDIEAVRAVCNKCKIILVEADSSSSADLAIATNRAAKMGATEISNSYGGPEGPRDTASIRAAYDHPGVVVTASTGDDGWFSWDRANQVDQNHPKNTGASANVSNTPASYPTVVAVTGTALALNVNGTRAAEEVWNENGPDDQTGIFDGPEGASGGGCSHKFAAPSWQAGIPGYSHTGCGSKRLAGDVAALADPQTGFDVYDTFSGGWVTVGGTSLSAPLIAAMYALAGGAGGVDYPARTLYDRFRHTPSALFDVQAGGNSFCAGDSTSNCSAFLHSITTPPTGNPNNLANGNLIYKHPYPGWDGLLDCKYKRDGIHGGTVAGHTTECDAAPGYDGPSGVGAPAGLTLFTPRHPSVALIGPSLIRVGHSASFSADFGDLTGGGATAVTYHFKWGDGHTTNTGNASASHTFQAKGTYHVTVTVTDSNNVTTAPSTRTYTIGIKPSVSISGATHFKVHTHHTWTAQVKEVNTGGAITAYKWELNGSKIATGPTIVGSLSKAGTYHLSVTVTDNSGFKTTTTEKLTVTHA